jgi:hypothetical protein
MRSSEVPATHETSLSRPCSRETGRRWRVSGRCSLSLLLILASLSVLWDFRVFTQIYVLQSAGGINRRRARYRQRCVFCCGSSHEITLPGPLGLAAVA